MKRLNEELWPIVKEYTRQVAELMGCCEWHWIGTNDDGESPLGVCDFGDVWFLSLEEMQVIIDRMDDWVRRYGSKEAVAQEVRDWFDWWLGNIEEVHPIVEICEARRNMAMVTIPRINLKHWLMGCPREAKKTVEDELRVLRCQRDMVKELAEKYRGERSLCNVVANLEAEIKEREKNGKRVLKKYEKV